MLVLVTGGGGFLGSEIVRQLLARGDAVRTFTRSPQPALAALGCDCRQGDIADAAAVRAAIAGVDAVVHTAAKAGVWGTAAEFFRVNVTGTQNVLDGCRAGGVATLVHTSTPSVVYNGCDLAGADETLPLTRRCPCAYPTTKAEAERRVLAANGEVLAGGAVLRTIALRPHLIWGAGDPHLVPRIVAAARAGRLKIVGTGRNRVDLTHVKNAAGAHLLALDAIAGSSAGGGAAAAGKPYFISDGAPVVLWTWLNALLERVGVAPVTRRVSLRAATLAGSLCELAWRLLPLRGEPPMTRFVAAELAKEHWFDISAARRDLGYVPLSAGTLAGALDALISEQRTLFSCESPATVQFVKQS